MRQKKFRQKQVKEMEDMAKCLEDNFPMKELCTMSLDNIGVTDIDSGGHHKTINCTHTSGGKFTIGLSYENDGKKKRSNTDRCQKSIKHILLLKIIESSILKFTKINHPTTYLRAQFLYGVQTLKHTDSFCGNYYSYLIAFDPGYTLTIRLFPKFRTSVVEYAGSRYIPLSYNTKNGFMAITFEENQPMKRAMIDPLAYKTCLPVGEFDFVVVGVKNDGRIQIATLGYDEDITSSTEYSLLNQTQALARMTEVNTKPFKQYKRFTKIGVWQHFVPWQYIHWISSGDNVRRISVFFRLS
jgi:hypothetical protein